jgi:hypothetical protein
MVVSIAILKVQSTDLGLTFSVPMAVAMIVLDSSQQGGGNSLNTHLNGRGCGVVSDGTSFVSKGFESSEQ